jgi:hypothetical protein
MDVTFVCANLFERPAKIAAALSSQGVDVDLLTSNSSIQPSWKKYFRNIGTVTTYEEFRQALDSLPDSTPIHHFTSSVDGFTVALLKLNKRFVFDYKDVFPEVLSLPSDGQSTVLDAIIRRNLPVFHRDGQLDRYICARGHGTPSFYKHVPDFIWPNLPPQIVRYGSDYKSRISKIAFIGNFSIEVLEPSFAGYGQLPIIKVLAGQGFRYHFFPFRHDAKDQDPVAMREYLAFEKENEGFIFEGRQSLNELQIKLTEMGWGSQLFPAFHFESLQEKHYAIMPNIGKAARISDYIGAGLPLLCSEGILEVSDLIRSYGLGISVADEQLFFLDELIGQHDYSRLRRNVLDFSSSFLCPAKWSKSIQNYYLELQTE